MKRIFKHTIFALSAIASTIAFSSCDTDIESVNIVTPGIEQQNPELHANYLSDLRTYKASQHNIFIGYFDNSHKQPGNQSQRINALPDSIDYVCLSTPDSLTANELKEIEAARKDKATKFVYRINFDAIKLLYDTRKADFYKEAENKSKSYIEFNTFLVDSLQKALSYYDKYKFDGIIFAYNGKPKQYMSDLERTTFIGYENDFILIALDWAERHPNVEILFQGKPQNVIDKQIFEKAKYIILPCLTATSTSELSYTAGMAADENVPTNKFIPLVQTTSLDKADVKTGYFSNKTTAIKSAARWVASAHNGYSIVGLAVENMATDYFNPAFVYPNIRVAINTINPNIKK